ncbi:MAG: histone deacetylase [Planctomycetaceae bacterium]|nr:histone deacetylase [Planctomycetaceae bacterium]
MPQVLLYDDPTFERHETGMHPERPERLQAIRQELARTGLAERCITRPIRPATIEELQRVHGAEYITTIRAASEAGGKRLDPDTVASPDSYNVATHAAGTALDAVDRVLRGEASRALCLVRPPGHHALPNRAMGFCLFGNIALAAAHARAAHGLERVLIVDWDVHHGNGTQDIFYADGNVHFLSLHRFPFWPGSGDFDETGTGAGLGATLNVPLRFGLSRKAYRQAFAESLETAIARCRPELILLSAGFDAHAADPIGSLGLESEDFGELTRLVCDAAGQSCGGKVVSLLEGGYNVEKLAESVAIHLDGLLSYGDE